MILEPVTPISKKEQISILETCKKNFDYDHRGVCEIISIEVKKRGLYPSGVRYTQHYIPLLKKENAVKFCSETKNTKVVQPRKDGEDEVYWWERNEKTTRLYFINWMIRQLKKS